MADAVDSDNEHARYAAYCEAVDAGQPLDRILDLLATDPDPAMADSVRIRMVDRATSRESIGMLAGRPDFGSAPVQRKVSERIAILDAREAQSDEQLLAVVATGVKRAHLELLNRPYLPPMVLLALSRNGATKAVRNRADRQLRRRPPS